MGLATPPIDLAIRLADEGVPLRAIARAVDVPSESLRDQLYKARDDGRLIELPKEDWPPGFPRDERALQLSRLMNRNRIEVAGAVRQLFTLTATEARVLLILVQSLRVARLRMGMGETLDVHIHHLRTKLKPHKIRIETIWAYGYQLSAADRQAITALILQHVASSPSL